MSQPAGTVVTDAGRLSRRVARSAAAIDALGTRIDRWFTKRRADPVFQRFATHFQVLEAVLVRMLARLRTELAEVGDEAGAGYERCRAVDRGLVTLRRLFLWYTAKYDQRGEGDYPAVLGAADEFARSCWYEGFAALGRKPPTGPLCFVDNRVDASARRRCEVPSELLPAIDDPVAEFVDRLPIPVIALPEPAVREGWWLVLAAHETGHHVLLDLGLESAVKQAVRTAVPSVLVSDWTRWHIEVFADVYSVLMVGAAAIWAVDELQFGARPHMLRPHGGYPAPVVRAALMNETLKALGAEPTRDAEDAATTPHLAVVPDVVAALLDLPLGAGTMRSLALDEILGRGPRLRSWSEQLTRTDPAISAVRTRDAPRVLVAAGVHRYQALVDAGRDESLPRLHTGLLSVLARSGAPGVLAPPAAIDIEELAETLSELLVERAATGESA